MQMPLGNQSKMDSTNSESVCDDAEPCPPVPPDMSSTDILAVCEFPHISFTTNGEIYRFKNCSKVCNFRASQREYDLMIAADCFITPYGRSFCQEGSGARMSGIIMELGIPLDTKEAKSSQRRDLVNQMISVVRTLHNDMRIIHGDIKPGNMLLRANGQLCLCDFAEARRVDEDPERWDGMVTDHYMSPNRCRDWSDKWDTVPEIRDDLYALGLSVWELYSGKMPFEGWYGDDIFETVKMGNTVDVNAGFRRERDCSRLSSLWGCEGLDTLSCSFFRHTSYYFLLLSSLLLSIKLASSAFYISFALVTCRTLKASPGQVEP